MLTSEHILLESDERDVPDPRTARKVHARAGLRSRLRRRVMQLDLIDYYYLAVRSRRGSSPPTEYVLDLRFADPSLRISRHVSWKWLLATFLLVVLALGVGWWIARSPSPWWRDEWLPVLGGLIFGAALAGLICAYRTTETFVLQSAHGRARLLEFTGGLGTIRSARQFLLKLVAHTQFAVTSRRPSRAQHLRDEMREHYRLKETGVLSEEEYEAGKARILSQHA